VSAIVPQDGRAHPEGAALSSTAGSTATKKPLDPIFPDEHECGVQNLTGIIREIDSEIDPGPDAYVGSRSGLHVDTVDLDIRRRAVQMGLNASPAWPRRAAPARDRDQEK